MNNKNEIKELIDQATILCGLKSSEEIADYLVENRVIKLPCKIGDMLYIKDRGKAKVIALYFDATGGMFDLDFIRNDDTTAGPTHFICKDYSFEDLGKTIFLNDLDANSVVKDFLTTVDNPKDYATPMYEECKQFYEEQNKDQSCPTQRL